MSIILKGIDIEKYKQAVIIYPSGKVYKCNYDGRLDNENVRQAVQIPKGHGRIGEIDLVWNDEGGEQFYDEPILLEAEEE